VVNNFAVCTLFENNYHYGVAALVNSLYSNGYRGDVFAGYKGKLPFWLTTPDNSLQKQWTGAKTLQVTNDLRLHFLPVETIWHLNNYKPDFMLDLKAKFPELVNGLFYFDPDIIIKYEWTFFEKWISYGVALVHEIVSVSMPPTHPIRKEWEKEIKNNNRAVQRSMYSGINGGFCGIGKNDFQFLHIWSNSIHKAIKSHDVDPEKFAQPKHTYLFHFVDQDALNIAAMCYEGSISEMGPDAMDFVQSGWKAMSHATGSPKPWDKQFILSILKGIPPSRPDQAYWFMDAGIIKTHNNSLIRLKRISIKISSFIARFYKKS
jgi:hypothetical protein